MVKIVGIFLLVVSMGGVAYNLNTYFDYKGKRDVLTNKNVAIKNVDEYNNNVKNINDLSNKANEYVFYAIAFCLGGGVSTILIRNKGGL